MDHINPASAVQKKVEIDLDALDSAISSQLGIPDYRTTSFGTVNIVNAEDVRGRAFEHEEGRYMGTPYVEIDRFLKILSPTKGDTLFDLGSGFGRIPIYGGLKYPDAKFVGIELSASRTKAATQSAQKLHLTNVEFLSGSVLINNDWSNATIFYMYTPFAPNTLVEVLRRLDYMAKNTDKRKLKLVCKGTINSMIDTKLWKEISHFSDIVIYESQ